MPAKGRGGTGREKSLKGKPPVLNPNQTDKGKRGLLREWKKGEKFGITIRIFLTPTIKFDADSARQAPRDATSGYRMVTFPPLPFSNEKGKPRSHQRCSGVEGTSVTDVKLPRGGEALPIRERARPYKLMGSFFSFSKQ